MIQILSFHSHFPYSITQVIFRQFDLDKSGAMSSYEMRLAVEAAGWNARNNHFQQDTVLTTHIHDDCLIVQALN